jgi:2-polyprenyl-3-methyl-5-hydroxy-6-metoxy-1,4-benzoquinol methylase
MLWWKSRINERERSKFRNVVFERRGDLVDLSDRAVACANSYNVASAIHFDDLIFAALHTVAPNKDLDVVVDTYFASGRVSAERVRDIASLYYAERPRDRPPKILDFASGYGCVSRHLRNVMPSAEVMACDIHPAACDFHRQHLGIDAKQSVFEPERLAAQPEFDIVIAISFFSHLPKRSFVPWLRKLGEFVRPNGILIFTTHGVEVHRASMSKAKVGRDGYGSIEDSEQFDIPLEHYVHSITYPKFVYGAIEQVPEMELRMQFWSLWWLAQDAYVLRRR